MSASFALVAVIAVALMIAGLALFQGEARRIRQFDANAFTSGLLILHEPIRASNKTNDANMLSRHVGDVRLFIRRTTASIFGAYPAGRLVQREPGDWRVEVRITPGFAMFYAGASMLAFEIAVVSQSIVVWCFALLTLLAGVQIILRERQWARMAASMLLIPN